jgi:hypothetical protein
MIDRLLKGVSNQYIIFQNVEGRYLPRELAVAAKTFENRFSNLEP